ncbi:hypothetical protein NIES4071_105330 (plasmid) [Calothrix sp. NIES-4071]|nr:hypothetical protein NIES4071_105330 [Calothrix sp. NIES-4071]BAZ64951.1 hypothetical protein NIES4105_106840 [Calothrix sp. NIES-4105]
MTHTNLDVAPVQQVKIVANQEAPEFEIDTEHYPELGTIYRLWQGWNLLGIFYCDSADGKWVTQPSCSSRESRCDNPDQAQLLIVTVSGLLVEGDFSPFETTNGAE